MLTIDDLQRKRAEYFDAYMNALATANANHGAVQALDDLIEALNEKEVVKDANSTSSDSN